MANSSRMQQLDRVVSLTRQYFAMEYHAGTRYMIERYIFRKTGESLDPMLISAALQILKGNKAISMDGRVWWSIADR
jgi:hypothetical protein